MHIFDFKTKINCLNLVFEKVKNEPSIVPNQAHMASPPASWQQYVCACGCYRMCWLRAYQSRRYSLQCGVTGGIPPDDASR